MTTSIQKKRKEFIDGPLHKFLVEVLPTFVKDPFGANPTLDVIKLVGALPKSHEAIYKWLRKSRLTPQNAQILVDLSNREDNVRALKRLDRTPPTLQDFHPFFFSA